MPNFFRVTLDTTPPIVVITAPRYTTLNEITPIVITANETLSPYGQDIYIVDQEGHRFDLTLGYLGKGFAGSVYLNQLSIGTATIFANISDEVRNVTRATAFFHIDVLAYNVLSMDISHDIRLVEVSESIRSVDVLTSIRLVEEYETIRPVDTSTLIRSVDVSASFS